MGVSFNYTDTGKTMADPDMQIFFFGFMHLIWFITKLLYVFRFYSDLTSVCLRHSDLALLLGMLFRYVIRATKKGAGGKGWFS